MSFRIRGLEPEPFAGLIGLDEAALAARGVRRVIADEPYSAPCRVSLEDAVPGESLLLLSYDHMPSDSPFKASGPIFVREQSQAAFDRVGEVPAAIQRRTISARAYDREAMMLEGELVEGPNVGELLMRWLARPDIDVVHLHYARRGCFAAVAERA